jgi:hypothetical protein
VMRVLLSCGPKCTATPKPISNTSVVYACREFADGVRHLYYKYNKLVRLPDAEKYEYARASLSVETYLTNVRNKLLNAEIRSRQKGKKCLCFDPDILVKESDKNLGLCVLRVLIKYSKF